MKELIVAREYLINLGIDQPEIGVVLGTGLNQLIDYVNIVKTIPYSDIPGFPVSTVEYHKGNLVYGKIGNNNILVMQGRLHSYEGYAMQQIVFPIRVMKLLGVKKLFLSNLAGGINLQYKKGDLVIIEDHINLLNGNPLTGKNLDELGSRFPDMSEPYDLRLISLLKEKAAVLNIDLKTGVYVAVPGPNLETKAEYRFLKIMGADMVGMSTVPEVIAANHMKLPCLGVSIISDECDPENLKPINIDEIIEIAGRADGQLSKLFYETIAAL